MIPLAIFRCPLSPFRAGASALPADGRSVGKDLSRERVHDSVAFSVDFFVLEESVEGLRGTPLIDPAATGERFNSIAARTADLVNPQKNDLVDELLIGVHPGHCVQQLRWPVRNPGKAIILNHYNPRVAHSLIC